MKFFRVKELIFTSHPHTPGQAHRASRVALPLPHQPEKTARILSIRYTLSTLLPSQVIALSWPSEGAFGKKVLRNFPADDPKRYAWLRAARKSYQVRA